MFSLPSKPRMLARGLIRRCPVCGRGKLFRRWFSMVRSCPRCGLMFEQPEGAFLGSMTLNYSVAGIAWMVFLGVALAVTLPDPPLIAILAGSLAVITLVAAATFPFSKTVWAAFAVMLRDPADIEFTVPDEIGPGG